MAPRPIRRRSASRHEDRRPRVNEFKIAVDRLDEDAAAFEFDAPAAWWEARQSGPADEFCAVETPFRFSCVLQRVREDLLLIGDLEGKLTLECSRCAKRYSHALRDSFRLVLSPAKDRESIDPEGERGLAENGLCLGEDLDTGWFRGPVIRLDDFFGEVIALAMPLQPLCRSDCPGICPHCGIDRSQEQCDCADEKIDSPFAVLAQLKGENE
jgi:uncharacterized protein